MAKIKVKQSTIDEIKKMGMTKALASAKTRRTPEYQEAIKRMYGAKRLAKATAGAKSSAGKSIPAGGVMGTKRAQVMAGPVKSTLKKKVVKRDGAGKVVKRQSWSDLTPRQKQVATAKIKAERNKTSRTAGKVVGAVVSPLGPVGAAAAVYGLRDYRKKLKK